MGSLTRSLHAGRGTREKIGRGMRGLRARLLPSRWRRPKRETPEAFIRSHRLAPAMAYARTRVRATLGEPLSEETAIYGYDLGAPFLAMILRVDTGVDDSAPYAELQRGVEPLLDLEDALRPELRQRFGARVAGALHVSVYPALPARP